MYINKDLPYKEKTYYASLGVWIYFTIKAQKILRKQVRIIYPSLGLWSGENIYNLTFRGYLAGTTPVLFARSSLFIVQVSFRACEDRVAH